MHTKSIGGLFALALGALAGCGSVAIEGADAGPDATPDGFVTPDTARPPDATPSDVIVVPDGPTPTDVPLPMDLPRVDGGPTNCRSNADCPSTQYCLGDGCATAGTCVARPSTCTTLYAPVCGCDGRTYSNACVAAGSGQRVASTGQCPMGIDAGPVDVGVVDATPIDTGVPATCTSDAECGPGLGCCGLTGRCYDTRCLACCMFRPDAGAVDTGTVSSCRSNADCAASQFCAGAGCGTTGTCAARPEACITLYAPVCGCDGHTYSNECVAAGSGQRVSAVGACGIAVDGGVVDVAPVDVGVIDAGAPDTGTTVCRSSADCAAGTECCLGTGRCYNPACLACCMVSVDAGAPDIGTITGCRTNADCGASQYCAGTGCGTTGTCADRPAICTSLYAPVCGCDMHTYSNNCVAAGAGVRVASTGACL